MTALTRFEPELTACMRCYQLRNKLLDTLTASKLGDETLG